MLSLSISKFQKAFDLRTLDSETFYQLSFDFEVKQLKRLEINTEDFLFVRDH